MVVLKAVCRNNSQL